MADALSRKSPAPLAGGKDRANIAQKQALSTIGRPEQETDFAATWIAARFHLPHSLARTIAALANVGRAFQ